MEKTKIITVLVVSILVIAGIGVVFYMFNNAGNNDRRALLSDSLEVYGNANDDWTIDSKDVEYVERIINGEVEESQFADANRDGKIDSKDINQIKALANDTATEVWIVDGVGETMKVNCKPQRVHVFQTQNAEIAAIMQIGEYVVSAGPPIKHYADWLFPPGKKESIVYTQYDYEILTEMDLDLYLVFAPTQKDTPKDMLPDVDVVYLGLYTPVTDNLEQSTYGQGILKAGYIFGCKDRAEGFLNFLLEIRDEIQKRTALIPDDERVNVLTSGYSRYFKDENDKTVTVCLESETTSQAAALAGARNVAEILPTWSGASYSQVADLEWLDTVDIDWVTLHYNYYEWSGDPMFPAGGFSIKDPVEMYQALNDIATRPLLGDLNHDQIMILPQEFRNGSTGGVLLAAYLAKAFYPEYFADFNPDAYMEEFIKEWWGVKNYNFEEYNAFIAYGNLKNSQS